MNSFSNYLNKIKADDSLKESTKQYVLATLYDAQSVRAEKGIAFTKRKARRKRMTIAFSSLVAFAIITIGGYRFYNTPMNYISVDINPSVEFGINILNKVVSQEAYNEEGSSVINASLYTNMSLENVIAAYIREANAQGYISDDGTTAIALTVESNQEKTAVALQNICSAEIESTLQSMNTSAVVYTAWVNLEFRQQTQESGLSPGKYRLIETMQAFDQGITFNEYKNATISDILSKTEELRMRNQIRDTNTIQPLQEETPDSPATEQQQSEPSDLSPNQEQTQPIDSQPQKETNNDHSNQQSFPDNGTTEKRKLQ